MGPRPTRICPACTQSFVLTRKDRRYCNAACRSSYNRSRNPTPLVLASPLEDVTRSARARLTWLRQEQGLGPLEPSTRLDLEASLQAQRIALQVSEVLLAQAPPGPRFVTSAFATDRLSARELAAATDAGCGAAWSADGRLFLVLLLGSSTPRGDG